MNTYLIVSALILIILGIIWKDGDLLNFVIKACLIIVGCAGIFYWLINSHYIVKI